MKIHLKSKGFELTPALHQLIEKKFSALDKFLVRWETNGEILLRVELAKTTQHHNKGMVYYVEANLDMPNNLIRIEEIAEDIHAGVDLVRDRLKRHVLKLKAKLADH